MFTYVEYRVGLCSAFVRLAQLLPIIITISISAFECEGEQEWEFITGPHVWERGKRLLLNVSR